MQPNKRGYALLPLLLIMAALAFGIYHASTTTTTTQNTQQGSDPPVDPPGPPFGK